MQQPYTIEFTKTAEKELKKHTPKIQTKIKKICEEILSINPGSGKKLVGDLAGLYSLRINIKDRIVYEINKRDMKVFILSVKTHYGE